MKIPYSYILHNYDKFFYNNQLPTAVSWFKMVARVMRQIRKYTILLWAWQLQFSTMVCYAAELVYLFWFVGLRGTVSIKTACIDRY